MIVGITASQRAPSIGSIAAGSLAGLDFINHLYWVGLTTYEASAIVDKPSQIIGGGLEVNPSLGPVAVIGDILAAFVSAAGLYGLVVEWDQTDGGGSDIVVVQNASSVAGGYSVGYIELWTDNPRTGVDLIDSEPSATQTESFFSGLPDNTSPMRAAYSRDVDRLSISVNGGAVVTSVIADEGIIPAAVTLGGGRNSVCATTDWSYQTSHSLPCPC